MNQENTLEAPAEFDGVYRFTNFSEEDFTTLWNNIEYTFAKKTTSPIIIPSESAENIQNIRKIFAKRLAQREFYAGNRYTELNELTKKTGVPPLVDEDKEFAPFIQKCLEPLPVGKVTAKKIPKSEAEVSEHTKVIGEKDSLKAGTTDATGQLEGLPNE